MSYSQRADQGYLSLARGLVTESSKLSAVEGATSDELNMVLDTEGMIRRRRHGLELLTTIDPTPALKGRLENSFYWDVNDILVYVSRTQDFDEFDEPTDFWQIRFTFVDCQDISQGTILKEYSVLINKSDYAVPQFAEIRDRIAISMGAEPIVVWLNSDKEFNISKISLYIRDFKLLDDGLRIAERPSNLSSAHNYNLLNAGWWQKRSLKSANGVEGFPIANFNTVRSEYPSNADVSYLGNVVATDGSLEFDPEAFTDITTGNSEAPRGHYVFLHRSINRNTKLISPTNDGTPSSTLIPIIEGGELPGGGTPPPADDPIGPPPPERCISGEPCTIEP